MRRLIQLLSVVTVAASVASVACAFASAGSSSASEACRPDRRTGMTVMRVYNDPIGDAAAQHMDRLDRSHGDIGRVRISDTRGIVTIRITVKNLRASDDAHIDLDTDCDGGDNFGFGFNGAGDAYLNRYNKDGGDDLGLPASVARSTTTYTFRFNSARFGKTTAFRFWLHVNTEEIGSVSDVAPDENLDRTYYYDLTSR